MAVIATGTTPPWRHGRSSLPNNKRVFWVMVVVLLGMWCGLLPFVLVHQNDTNEKKATMTQNNNKKRRAAHPKDVTKTMQRRRSFSPGSYIDMPKHTVGGWLDLEDLYAVQLLSRGQHRLGLTGSVGEIGVHHGLLFVGMVLASSQEEQLYVADVFEEQTLNLDASGRGDEGIFLRNLKRYAGIDQHNVTLFKGSSLNLSANDIAQRGISKTRMFSIDGCHTYECTLNDLGIASQALLDQGGIVLLDDFAQTNPETDTPSNKFVRGVSTAALKFLKQQERNEETTLVPFFATANKLYFTSAAGEYADLYTQAIRQSSLAKCMNGEMSLGGFSFLKLDWNKRTHFNDDCAKIQPGCKPCITRDDLHEVFAM